MVSTPITMTAPPTIAMSVEMLNIIFLWCWSLGELGATSDKGSDEEIGLKTIGFGMPPLQELFCELQRPALSEMKE
uniref:Uncharacterized protein n=1 Tax=Arundo donax TaxID=35708 RepID=A0A0A9EGZ1_ARUDO